MQFIFVFVREMSSTTRTGLVPTPTKRICTSKKARKAANERLPAKFEAKPMALALRPFGGLYNPFAKGCSVLCNHPAPSAVKDIIQQLKTSLATEAKHVAHTHETVTAATAIATKEQRHRVVSLHGSEHIPDDLFRRYTDSDSRPLTPTPTVTSVHTRTSAGSFLNRRCITPELGKNDIIKRKKIILDLRRSHSQETLYWKPPSDLSQSVTATDTTIEPPTKAKPTTTTKHTKPKSAGDIDDKKSKRPKSVEQRSKSSLAIARMPSVESAGGAGVEQKKQALVPPPTTCINEHDLGDEDVRRGKKRKKLKTAGVEAKPSATFHLSEDPETQVATLGPDSMNPSTRPSLIPNSVSLLPSRDKESDTLLKGSFLTDEAFQALKTELDVDVIENAFGRYLNRALREAIKYIPPKPPAASKMNDDKEKPTPSPPPPPATTFVTTQTKMPRKFSKSATRFEVPLNLKALETLTVLEYLSTNVWVSRQRKQLDKRGFLKYLKKVEDVTDQRTQDAASTGGEDGGFDEDKQTKYYREYVERTMPMESLPQALEDALEFHGTEKNIKEMLRLLDFENMKEKRELNFRTWCGVVAFAERLALVDPNCTDSCDELEKADFSSLEQRLDDFKTSANLRQVFSIIRQTHSICYVVDLKQEYF